MMANSDQAGSFMNVSNVGDVSILSDVGHSKLNISAQQKYAASAKKRALNTSIMRQTLKANNRALARALTTAKEEIKSLRREKIELKCENQELRAQLTAANSAARLDELFDEAVQEAVRTELFDEMCAIDAELQEIQKLNEPLKRLGDIVNRHITGNVAVAADNSDAKEKSGIEERRESALPKRPRSELLEAVKRRLSGVDALAVTKNTTVENGDQVISKGASKEPEKRESIYSRRRSRLFTAPPFVEEHTFLVPQLPPLPAATKKPHLPGKLTLDVSTVLEQSMLDETFTASRPEMGKSGFEKATEIRQNVSKPEGDTKSEQGAKADTTADSIQKLSAKRVSGAVAFAGVLTPTDTKDDKKTRVSIAASAVDNEKKAKSARRKTMCGKSENVLSFDFIERAKSSKVGENVTEEQVEEAEADADKQPDVREQETDKDEIAPIDQKPVSTRKQSTGRNSRRSMAVESSAETEDADKAARRRRVTMGISYREPPLNAKLRRVNH